MTNRMLIKAGHVLSMDDAVGDLPTGDVLIENGKIASVAALIEADDAEIIDATGMIVSPGFVDTHRHVWQTQLRGTATDWSLLDYSVIMRHGYSSSYDAEDAYLGNYVGALEALNAGITTIVDHSHLQISEEHSDGLVNGLKDAGIRGIFCYAMYNNPTQRGQDLDVNRNYTELSQFHVHNAARVKNKHFTGSDDLLQFGLATSEWSRLSTSAPALDEIRWMRELNPARISIHIGMGINESIRFVPALADAGLLDDDLLFVHGSHLTDDDLRLLADHGGWVSTTPDTELQMGMGFPVAERVAATGKEPSLGIDIVSNIAGNMFSQMHLMLQAWRMRDYEREAYLPLVKRYPARNMLRTATLGGAIAAGLGDRTGSITPGKAADLVLTRTDSMQMAPVNDATGALVFYADPSDVDTVFVGGKAVKRHGELVDHDWSAIRERLLASRSRIMARFERLDLAELETTFRASWHQASRGSELRMIDPA